MLNGTRADQPVDLVESITNYDLPFRATVYDLVFCYLIGERVGNLGLRSGALHVEVSPFHLVNGTIEVNRPTPKTRRIWGGSELAGRAADGP